MATENYKLVLVFVLAKLQFHSLIDDVFFLFGHSEGELIDVARLATSFG